MDSDDEEDAPPAPRKPVVSNEVIHIDSESDNDEDNKDFFTPEPGETYMPNGDIKPSGDVDPDAHHEDHEDMKMVDFDDFDDFGEVMMLDDDFNEDTLPDNDGEEHEQDYEYEADYLLGGPIEVQIGSDVKSLLHRLRVSLCCATSTLSSHLSRLEIV
jgi:hypothetical protein